MLSPACLNFSSFHLAATRISADPILSSTALEDIFIFSLKFHTCLPESVQVPFVTQHFTLADQRSRAMMHGAIFASFFSLPLVALGYPYYLNTTNDTTPSVASPLNDTTPSRVSSLCQTFYTTQLRVVNSRYPDWDMSPLHDSTDMFMLLRQRDDTFQIATQVQFLNVSTAPNTTCRLQFQLPDAGMQTVAGPNPTFNVYQVEREAGSMATWYMYVARNLTQTQPPVFGQVGGTDLAQFEQWRYYGGLYTVGQTACNDTLTFQMGMAFNGGNEVNYWEFLNIGLPATPVQGFRVSAGC